MFKLFHLSVLWRAAVSTGFKVSDDISLGPYERQLAGLIRQGDSGKPGDFPFLGVLSVDSAGHPVATVSQLAKGEGRFEGRHYYLMNYAFCDWIFVVARPGPEWMAALEAKFRAQKCFILLTVPHRESKSFKLAVDALRKLRR